MYLSTKKFGPFSCAFRQPLAESHCRFVHGYGLTFQIDFAATELDKNGWVIDFGALKSLKAALEGFFDHKLVITSRDPLMDHFVALHKVGGCDLAVYNAVGIEAFAKFAHFEATCEIGRMHQAKRVKVVKVECWEHPINSAVYQPG